MAIVKITFIKHAQNAVNYILRERGPNDLVDADGVIPEEAAKQFKEIAKLNQGKGGVQALHIIQSWNEEESKKLPAETFQSMGKTLIERKFPGHDFVIVTHTNTGKTHNHILVNPWHRETGKKIENKKYHLYQLRDVNDKICQEHGLSVINKAAKERAAHLPPKVQQMMRFNGTSFLLDIMQKADFARAYSTNYDQYVSLLGEFNIMTNVQEKNITYFYPGHTRGKRGSKLGKLYDKKGLDESFRLNQEKFAKHPELAALLRSNIDRIKRDPKHTELLGKRLETTSEGHFQFGYRDLNALQKDKAPSDRYVPPSIRALKDSPLPPEIMRQASTSSIPQYCRENKIGLEKFSESSWKLKDKPFVHIQDQTWKNTKNKTHGNLVDFVSIHREISILQAVAHITKNPNLLLLEDKFGEVKRSFTSFYFPKDDAMDRPKGERRLGNLLRSFGASAHHAEHLLSRELAQVNSKGIVRIFAEKDDQGAYEWETNQYGRWTKKKQGNFKSPFISKSGSDSKVLLFLDPWAALSQKKFDLFSPHKGGESLLVLMEPNVEVVDQFLKKNPHIKHLELIGTKQLRRSEVELDFFHNLKNKYQGHENTIEWLNAGRGLFRGGPEAPGLDF